MLNQQALDRDIAALQANKQAWARASIEDKIKLFKQVLDGMYQIRDQQVQSAIEHKQIPTDSPLAGEEWMNGPVLQCRTIRLVIESLERIQNDQLTWEGQSVERVSDEQLKINVFPTSSYDRLMFAGFKASVWIEPGVDERSIRQNTASMIKQDTSGCVSLVLGAGNVASIGPLDVIQKLLEGKVVLLKMNPVNDYLAQFFEQAFKPLIDKGFLRIVKGGAAEGEYLCQHPKIEDIHITGSDKTHDIICYGAGEQGELNKKRSNPRLDKNITSELGNVTPIIIVPGQWTQSELEFHAENVATQLANNAGFNCLAARVLVLADDWPQKDDFMRALGEAFEKFEPRVAYYPGAHERYQNFIAAHKAATKQYGKDKAQANMIPWTVIEGLDPDADTICYKEEAFCGVMAQTNIHATSVNDFLKKAVSFCNDKLWGTLSACVIIDPKTRYRHQNAFDRAIKELRYGSIGINQWHALAYALGSTTWGAYPGHTMDNIQSGRGTVHNTYLLDKPQKSVVEGPFTTTWLMPFKPAWFGTNKAMLDQAKALCEMEYRPNLFNFLRLVWVTVSAAIKRQLSGLKLGKSSEIAQQVETKPKKKVTIKPAPRGLVFAKHEALSRAQTPSNQVSQRRRQNRFS